MISPYPWKELIVRLPWGVVIRARRADDQARHGRGDPQGGQFATEETARNPEEPIGVSYTQKRFKNYNRLRVKLAKMKRRAKEKFGTDLIYKYDDETEREIYQLQSQVSAAKAVFKSAQQNALNDGIRINALGKWTNQKPDKRLMKEAAKVRERMAKAQKELDDFIANDPEIEAVYAEARKHMQDKGKYAAEFSKLTSVLIDRGLDIDPETWPSTDANEALKVEYLRAESLMMDAEMKQVAANKRAFKLQTDAKEKWLKGTNDLVRVDNPLGILATRSNMENGEYDRLPESLDLFSNLVDWDVFPGMEVDEDSYLKVPLSGTDDKRSYFSVGVVHLSRKGADDRNTVAHEMGHWLSDNSRNVRYKANQFLKKRAGDEEPSLIYDRGLDMDDDGAEIGYKDKFKSHYTGKLYGGRENAFQMNSTEIISMGLGYMATDPIQFAQDDPEFFDFIYTIARGG